MIVESDSKITSIEINLGEFKLLILSDGTFRFRPDYPKKDPWKNCVYCRYNLLLGTELIIGFDKWLVHVCNWKPQRYEVAVRPIANIGQLIRVLESEKINFQVLTFDQLLSLAKK